MTLVGVLIGITILAIALAAEIRLMSDTIRREADLKNLIIATNLAREGVEIAFSWRCSKGWDELKGLRNGKHCTDISDLDSVDKADCENDPLNFSVFDTGQEDIEAHLYQGNELPSGLSSYSYSSFWRTIEVDNCDDNPNEDECLTLRAKAWWDPDKKNDKQVTLEKRIYNWYIT